MKTTTWIAAASAATVLCLSGAVFAAGAKGKAKEPAKPALSAAVVAEATELFAARCAVCHGAAGLGDGVAAAGLVPKPRNYSDAVWQKSVTDDQIRAIVVEGGPAVGKSPLMPSNPDLAQKADVVSALVAQIRLMGKKK